MKRRGSIIGLTGGIGAGKSAAASRFQSLGARVIDADVLARAALDPGGICYDEVLAVFGREIRKRDGVIDRKRLAGIVFADPEKLKRLNAIVHPRVIADMLGQADSIVSEDADAVAVLDVPLLFECGMEKSMDYSLLVYAGDALRISRIVLRDGCSAEEADARIRAQMTQEEKCARADFVLYNDGPLEALYGQTDALYQRLRGERQ